MSSDIEHPHSHSNLTDERTDEAGDSLPDDGKTTSGGAADRKRSDLNVRKTRSQEAVKTLLASFGDNLDECSEEFGLQDVKYKDLSALSERDLIMLGVTDPETQSLMLETFQELPNQELHYDRLRSSDKAQEFNDQILSRAQNHLNSMNTSLSAAYLKMLVSPSNDVIVDDSIFASRFVLQALDELKKATDDMEDRLRTLEQVAIRNAKVKSSTRSERHLYKALVITAGICAGMSIAFWYWKGR